MARYLRNYVPGGTFFFTVVTCQRQRILTTESSRKFLRDAFHSVRRRWPFQVTAIVLLPEHLHAVWTLPPNDANYSLRWQKIKQEFTSAFMRAAGPVPFRRQRSGERQIWQPRFWEHTCRDANDLKRCVDYAHYNPLKHGHVTRVQDWPWSSFHRYVKLGEYPRDWGTIDPCPMWTQPEW